MSVVSLLRRRYLSEPSLAGARACLRWNEAYHKHLASADEVPSEFFPGVNDNVVVMSEKQQRERLKTFVYRSSDRSALQHGYTFDGKTYVTDGHRLMMLNLGLEDGWYLLGAEKPEEDYPDVKVVIPLATGVACSFAAKPLVDLANLAIAEAKTPRCSKRAQIVFALHDDAVVAFAIVPVPDSGGGDDVLTLTGTVVKGLLHEEPSATIQRMISVNATYLKDALWRSQGTVCLTFESDAAPIRLDREDGEMHLIMAILTDFPAIALPTGEPYGSRLDFSFPPPEPSEIERWHRQVDEDKELQARFKKLFSKQEIVVWVQYEDETTEQVTTLADVGSGLAVHRTLDASRLWTVTHIESGQAVMQRLTSQTLAKHLCLRLVQAVDWSRPGEELVEDEYVLGIHRWVKKIRNGELNVWDSFDTEV